MNAPPRLRHDPEDEAHRLHCSHDACWQRRSQFLLGKTLVDLQLEASGVVWVVRPEAPRRPFQEGHVETVTCAHCGTMYFPHSPYDPE